MVRRSKVHRSKKPSVAAAKKVVTKLNKKKAKLNMDTFFLRAKTTAVVVPTTPPAGNPNIQNYVAIYATLDPANLASSVSYLGNAEFNYNRLQYDQFRVNRVRVTCVPKAQFLSLVDTQGSANGVLNLAGDGMVHTCIDRDSQCQSSIGIISRYPSYKKFSILKKWSRSYNIKYPNGIWINTQTPSSFSARDDLGLRGGVTAYCENVLETQGKTVNTPLYDILYEWDIVFRGKVSNNMTASFDESGNVISMTLTKADEDAPILPPSSLSNIRGTVADTLYTIDASGNSFDDAIDDLTNLKE